MADFFRGTNKNCSTVRLFVCPNCLSFPILACMVDGVSVLPSDASNPSNRRKQPIHRTEATRRPGALKKDKIYQNIPPKRFGS